MITGVPPQSHVRICFGAALIAIWAILATGIATEAQPILHRVAVLSHRLAYTPALEGFREALAQLGYTEGNNITCMVEDIQGDMKSLAA